MAKEHPRYENTEWPDWEFHEFPMMVYPGAADQKKPYDDRGRPLPGVIVNTAQEADEALGIDRSERVEEAEAAPAPAKPRGQVPTGSKGVSRMKTEDDERAELIAEAEVLGIQQFDRSWSIARMQDTIDTFKAGSKEVV